MMILSTRNGDGDGDGDGDGMMGGHGDNYMRMSFDGMMGSRTW